MIYSRKNIKVPHSEEIFLKIDLACEAKKLRKIFIAVDQEGRHHAGVYLVWDNESAYYLMGGSDPDLRNSGATSLCIWEAIKFASTVSKEFNFGGSMMEPVESFFRAFGGKQKLIFNISKTNSLLLRTFFFLKNIKN